MKHGSPFFVSFERYVRKLGTRNPLPYSWIVLSLGLLTLITSMASTSMASTTTVREAIVRATSVGDYTLAEQLYLQHGERVLGATSELEKLIYPERVITQRITELEQKLDEYPSNREIYRALANLYGQLGNQEQSSAYQEMARILDPNN